MSGLLEARVEPERRWRGPSGDLRLLDEALHLADALQVVGYRHVLASLWSISDLAAPAMAEITYAHLLHPDPHNLYPTDRPQAARAP